MEIGCGNVSENDWDLMSSSDTIKPLLYIRP